MGKCLIIVCFLIFNSLLAIAQDSKERYQLVTRLPYINTDSTVIIVTNRIINNSDSTIYFGNYVNSNDSIHYLVATCLQGKWFLTETESISSAATYIKNNRNIVFFVHGDGKTFMSSLERSAAIQSIYGVNVISFDYPSKIPGYSSLRNFYNSRKNVKKSLVEFDRFIKDIKTVSSHENIRAKNKTLFLHSLGNYLLKKYIDEFHSIRDTTIIDNLVMNAPAIRQGKHGKWLTRIEFQKRTYITSNKNDYTLKGAALITFSKQLGGNLRRTGSARAFYLNFSNTAGQSHNCFLDKDLLLGDYPYRKLYDQLLNGEELIPENSGYFKKRQDGLGWDLEQFILKSEESQDQ